jgi:uncharacterized protein involved in exopolysaccharide biosynthesis
LRADVEYTAQSTFLPQSEDAASPLAELPGGLGLQLTGSGQGESVDFYAALLKSRQVLGEVAATEIRFAPDDEDADSMIGTLIDFYEIEGETPESELLAATGLLEDLVSVTIDRRANLVTVRTTTNWSELSEIITRRLLELTNTFNLERRQSQAAAQRSFVEGRLREQQAELAEAEAELESFLDRNRSIESSPQLQFEMGRLQRRVELSQQVFVTLSQGYEEARIDEVRNIPVITIVDPPEGSAQSGQNLVRRTAIGFVLGGGLAVALVLLLEFLRRFRDNRPDQFGELQALLHRFPGAFLRGRSAARTAAE